MLWAYATPRGLGFENALGVADRGGVPGDQLSSAVAVASILRIPNPGDSSKQLGNSDLQGIVSGLRA